MNKAVFIAPARLVLQSKPTVNSTEQAAPIRKPVVLFPLPPKSIRS